MNNTYIATKERDLILLHTLNEIKATIRYFPIPTKERDHMRKTQKETKSKREGGANRIRKNISQLQKESVAECTKQMAKFGQFFYIIHHFCLMFRQQLMFFYPTEVIFWRFLQNMFTRFYVQKFNRRQNYLNNLLSRSLKQLNKYTKYT
jgi:hypothetical protein